MAHAYRAGEVSGRVLLADDEELVRGALRLILKSQGFQVVEAADGEEAVRKYLDAPQDYDVLLLDLDMPRLGGDEAWRQIKKQHQQARAILLSGSALIPSHCEGAAYLQKPFDAQELISLVWQMVQAA